MRYCLALDLKNDPNLIEEYEKHHQAVWPEILDSFKEAGILSMEIFRWENRLFLIMDTDASFSFERKNEIDANSPIVQQWENLMSTYQQALPGSKSGEKWQLMKRIFHTEK
ncbi:L-rhamnose mutarotase [Cecembia rubra]|uniref:L-rhamnose mutarotase n=1 Tax=Cecembia rubra TaxID=1485585 RepID=A0A2P8ECW3_9BACT|nr:L-rhamnose mutarotase [Cecembia rubra]PSL07322.1 L-rhamnose mutarotase [Cecembia rubra]